MSGNETNFPANKSSTEKNTKQTDEIIVKNSNSQSNVFQCEGHTCPTGTDSCKVTTESIGPLHKKLKQTVDCILQENKILETFEREMDNPNKGHRLSISKLYEPSKLFSKFPKL